MGEKRPPTFSEAVADLLLHAARPGGFDDEAYAVIVAELRAALSQLRLPEAVRHEVIDEAICRLLERHTTAPLDLDASPHGYLVRTARNEAYARLRRASRRADDPTRVDAEADPDDAIARRLAQLDSLTDVQRLWRAIAEADPPDPRAGHVLYAVRKLATQLDDQPAVPAVAAEAGVTPPTVRAILRYAREVLDSDAPVVWRRLSRKAPP